MKTERQILPDLAMAASLTNMGEYLLFLSDSSYERLILSSFSQGRTMLHCVLLPVRVCGWVCEWEREGEREAESASNGRGATAETGETAVSLQRLRSSPPPLPPSPLSLNEPLTPLLWPSSPTEQHGQGLHSQRTDTTGFSLRSPLRGQAQTGCMSY